VPERRMARVLVVENDPGVADLLAERLEWLGLEPDAVTSGREALELLALRRYELLVLDFSLPDMTAEDLIKSEFLPPFIVTAGRGDESLAVRMMKAGARDYLVKDGLFLSQFPIVVERTMREIDTERNLLAATESLATSERKFKMIFDDSPIGIGLFHPCGNPPDLNEAWRKILGSPRDAAVPEGFLGSFLSPETLAEAASGGIHCEERAIDTPRGRKIVEISVSGLRISASGDSYLVRLEDITARKAAEAKLRAAVVEKEHLLKEIHHRVKNNLQIVASLVSLQTPGDAEPQVADSFRGIQNRISAMALIHEALYASSDFSRIDFADYLRRLVRNLSAVYVDTMRPVDFSYSSAPVYLALDKAVPLALLTSELMTNALRHAFPLGWEGKAVLEAKISEPSPGRARLVVRDNGVGMEENAGESSLGIRLVRSLAGQLKATAGFAASAGGTVWTVELEVD
jgi:two-component sensor histidine kinase/PAS domain-containing protein